MSIPVIPPPVTTNWVCYNKMADQGIKILIIQSSDLGLGTQEYFQFSVSSKLRQSYAPFWQQVITVIVALFPKLKLNSVGWRLWSTDLLCVLHFLSVEYRLHSAFLTFPEFQRVDKELLIREGREYRNRRNNQMVVQPWDRVLVPTQRNMHNNVFWVLVQNWSHHPGAGW